MYTSFCCILDNKMVKFVGYATLHSRHKVLKGECVIVIKKEFTDGKLCANEND